jgi:hypothetical protein
MSEHTTPADAPAASEPQPPAPEQDNDQARRPTRRPSWWVPTCPYGDCGVTVTDAEAGPHWDDRIWHQLG